MFMWGIKYWYVLLSFIFLQGAIVLPNHAGNLKPKRDGIEESLPLVGPQWVRIKYEEGINYPLTTLRGVQLCVTTPRYLPIA